MGTRPEDPKASADGTLACARGRARRTLAGVRVSPLLLVCAMGATAHAGDNDLVLARLGKVTTDASGNPITVVGQNLEFRSLISELSVALAPRLLAPSDTLGFGGIQITTDLGTTSISNGASWWRAREAGNATGGLDTIGVFARKGFWFPVPSFEVGAGMVHLLDSHLWTGQVYGKLGLHEGYHHLPVPSVAARGAVSRLMGSKDIDLTVASFDVSVSKRLGIGGTWALSPYGGWNVLLSVPRGEVLDATPNIDPLVPGNEMDSNLDFVFKDQQDIVRQRFFFGAKMQYYVFQATFEASFALKGTSIDDRSGTDMPCTVDATTTSCDAHDQAGAQSSFTGSIGLDF